MTDVSEAQELTSEGLYTEVVVTPGEDWEPIADGPDIEVIAKRVSAWGVRHGSQARVRVEWPDSPYYFVVRPPRGNKEALTIVSRTQNVRLVGGQEDDRVDFWQAFLERAYMLVVDFCFPTYNSETGEIDGEARYKKDNGGKNPENTAVFDGLDTTTFATLNRAMTAIAGDDKEREDLERLKNEHGLLVQPMHGTAS